MHSEDIGGLQNATDEEGDDNTRKSRSLQGIENLVLSFLTQLTNASNPEEPTDPTQQKPTAQQRRANAKIQIQLVDRKKQFGDTRMRSLTYPKKCLAGSVRPLAQLFRVMDLAHEAIAEGVPMTKRDLFYNDVQLFKTQRTVDLLVDDLAATLNLDRADLNIRASNKGLVCGSGLTIYLVSGEMIQATDTEGILIPVGEDIESFGLEEDVRWVLIVEKEAVFQTLCRLRIVNHQDMPGRGLLITGKGYPDLATRHLVKTLADSLPRRTPIMCLVDADPYGLDILSVYSYGSQAMQHENDRLAAGGRITWIGVWVSELSRLGIDKDRLLPISPSDEKKAYAMLRRSENILPTKWKKSLVHMLHYRRKAEIEILSTMELVDRPSSLLDQSLSKTSTAEVGMHIDINSEGQCQELPTSHEAMEILEGGSADSGSTVIPAGVSVEHHYSVGTPASKTAISPPMAQSHNTCAPNQPRNALFWYLREKTIRFVQEYADRHDGDH